MVQRKRMAQVISTKLILYSVLFSGLYLLIMNLLLNMVERGLFFPSKRFDIEQSIPKEMLEKQDVGWFISNYIMEFLFYAAIPALSYAYFYIILPFQGVRTGVIIALTALVFGALPIITGIIVRIKFSMTYIVFLLFSFLIKIAGSMIIIGYLYTL